MSMRCFVVGVLCFVFSNAVRADVVPGMVYKSPAVAPYASPMMDSVTIDGGTVRVKFKNAEGGLMTTDGKAPEGFALAGEDGKYGWATARIEGDTVVLTSEKVESPKMVRYAWANNPAVNLVNRSKLPAAPFRYGEGGLRAAKSYSAWQHYLKN